MSLDVQSAQAQGPEQDKESGLEATLLDSEPMSIAEQQAGLDSQAGLQPVSPPQQRAEPVTATERLDSVDTLRGFALLGILAMNIVGFAWPWPAYGNPLRGGGFEGLDKAVWFFNHLLFEGKMMTIFSMLFGAGLVLMSDRALSRGASLRGVYYRRVLWLLCFGAVHAYLIWDGDILFLYAECGLLLYLFRNKTAKTLVIVGVTLMLLLVPLVIGFVAAIDGMKAVTARVDAQVKAGETPSRFDRWIHDFWTENLKNEVEPNREKEAEDWNKELEVFRGGYLGIVKYRAPKLFIVQTIGFLLGGFVFAASRMLLGMGLMKLRVFSGERSRRFYLWMAGLGYGIGLPLLVFDGAQMIRHEFNNQYIMRGGVFYNAYGSLIVALGHVGLLMLIIQSGALAWLTSRLAAVGRMALSNYLTHSLVCTTLFYGYGFGLFGTINRAGLAAIVLAIWVFQLWLSPIWLRHFRFGPAEWLWRSLTYWKRQPMRRVEPVAMAAPV